MQKRKLYLIFTAAVMLLACLIFSCKSSPKKGGKVIAESIETIEDEEETEESEDEESENSEDSESKESEAEDAEKSSDESDSDEESDSDAEDQASDETENTEEDSSEDADTGKKSKKKSKKTADKESETSEKEPAGQGDPNQNYAGWIKAASKNISETFGIIHLRVKSKFGAFSIGVKNDRGKTIPVLSTANEFVSNTFYLKTARRIYALGTDVSAKTAAQKRSDGAAILYSVPSVADVLVEFKCFSSEPKVSMDMIKVTATVTNRSTRIDDFSLKSVLDTVLGESDSFHFYNWEGIPVRNEVMYRTLQNQKWFVSKNNMAGMQLFYSGADCSEIELVALANRSTVEKNSWEPDMLSYRAFDTVLSYNDSAVCAIWKPLHLEPGQSGQIIFYMAFSVDGAKLNGEKYILAIEEPQKEPEPVSTVEKVTDASISMPYTTIPAEENPVQPVQPVPPVQPDVKPDLKEIPNVDFYIKNMTQEHLTPEYIQSLLDRIAALEEDSPSLNRQELLQLNAELDAILTYLRQ